MKTQSNSAEAVIQSLLFSSGQGVITILPNISLFSMCS